MDLRDTLRKRLLPYAPALLGSAVLGYVCMKAIVAKAGGPAAPLDDSFIHLQFAKRLAEGSFFSYVAGEGYSSGATSFLWPILLAPFYKIGLHGSSLVYAAWFWGTLAHAGVARESARLTNRLAGRAAGFGVMAMCLLFGAFAWFAWSGMETMGLAWALMRAARLGGAFAEPEGLPATSRLPGASADLRPSELSLVFIGLLGPLFRPEGLICSLIVAIALGARPRKAGVIHRLWAILPLLGPAIVPLVNLAFTGHAASATAQVKWLWGNPYFPQPVFLGALQQNLKLLYTSLLDGGDWTAIFLPEHSFFPLLLGMAALPVAALRRRVPFHALFVLMVVLGTLIPTTYLSFLWNRVRYIWPFAGAWFVLLGCLAREAGDFVRLLVRRATFVTPVIVGIFAGALAMKLPWTIKDLATSASAIERQQVALGRWASQNLPPDARIGVNDTGAIAYFGGRRTFDVVGLTTEGEARYWVAGAGSRFEHYEKTPVDKLPTHFIVYPHWMAAPEILGKELTHATVTDQSILGGVTMVAYEARWSLLGTGAKPAQEPEGMELFDELDVADLESEKAHRYELGPASDQDDRVESDAPEENQGAGQLVGKVVDGGRLKRAWDRFKLTLPENKPSRLVMRVAPEEAPELVVSVNGVGAGSVSLVERDSWVEVSLDLPASPGGASSISVSPRPAEGLGELTRPPTFASFHYWLYALK